MCTGIVHRNVQMLDLWVQQVHPPIHEGPINRPRQSFDYPGQTRPLYQTHRKAYWTRHICKLMQILLQNRLQRLWTRHPCKLMHVLLQIQLKRPRQGSTYLMNFHLRSRQRTRQTSHGHEDFESKIKMKVFSVGCGNCLRAVLLTRIRIRGQVYHDTPAPAISTLVNPAKSLHVRYMLKIGNPVAMSFECVVAVDASWTVRV